MDHHPVGESLSCPDPLLSWVPQTLASEGSGWATRNDRKYSFTEAISLSNPGSSCASSTGSPAFPAASIAAASSLSCNAPTAREDDLSLCATWAALRDCPSMHA